MLSLVFSNCLGSPISPGSLSSSIILDKIDYVVSKPAILSFVFSNCLGSPG